MSLAATCWWTLARTVILCLLAWPVCRLIERSFHHLSSACRPWFLAGLLAPCCFPELLVGYAFRDLALARREWAEALCGGMLFVRMIPIGAITLLAAPRSQLDAAAFHCRLMVLRSGSRGRKDWKELARCYWHGRIVRGLPALGLMSIVAFQEFEMAALLQTMSWTDWFITAKWQGLEWAEMMRQSLMPLLWQLPVLAGVLYWLRQTSVRKENDASPAENLDSSVHLRSLRWGVFCVVIGVAAGCLIPLGLMGWRSVDGLALLLRQRPQQIGLAREIAISGAIAACATASAWSITGWPNGSGARKQFGTTWDSAILASLLLPGLFGSLLLSLGCVALFQWPWLRPLYDTPIPWVLTLTVWLLPREAILRVWLRAFRNDEAIHLAEMLPGGRGPSSLQVARLRTGSTPLLWHLRDQPQFLAASLLWYWAYCDLPTAYMLAPSGMTSGLVRLYNFMHFGHSAALSAEAGVFFGVPVVVLLLLLIVKRKFR